MKNIILLSLAVITLPVAAGSHIYQCSNSYDALNQQFMTSWVKNTAPYGAKNLAFANFASDDATFKANVFTNSQQMPSDKNPHLSWRNVITVSYIRERGTYGLDCVYHYSNPDISAADFNGDQVIHFTAESIAKRCKATGDTVVCH